jgi:hypothetical protein
MPGIGLLERGPAGSPFPATRYGTFRAENVYVLEDLFPGASLKSSFTIEAHLQLTESGVQGARTIVGNEPSEGGAGFTLMVEDGQPAGRIWTSGSVEPQVVRATESLVPGRWYRVVYRYWQDTLSGNHHHDIWIDGKLAAEAVVEADLPRMSSSATPAVGASRDPAGGFMDWLDANVMAVQIHDYNLDPYYLSAKLIRDGTRYFGWPAFHNYLGLDGEAGGKPLEQRMVDTYFEAGGAMRYGGFDELVRDNWVLPLLNDGYVVQGMAGDPENHRLFLAMYHRRVDGVSYSYASVVVEILMKEEYRLGRVFMLHDEKGLPLYSHVGGIAYWNGLLYVPGPPRSTTRDPDVFVYEIPASPGDGFNPHSMEGFTALDLDARWKLRDPIGGLLGDAARFNSISFMGIHLNAAEEVILHLGNFQSTSPAPVHLFRLGLEPDQPPQLTPVWTHIQSHRRTQSVYYFYNAEVANRAAWKTFQATSYGNNDSVLYTDVYLEDRTDSFGSEFTRMPAGLEEIFCHSDRVWMTSESGSLYYQKRSNPWTDLYPFLAVLDAGSVVDINNNTIRDQWEAKYGLTGVLDPDSDGDGDGFTLRQEYGWDTNPKDPLDFPHPMVAEDFSGFILPSGNGALQSMAFGTFSPGSFYRLLVHEE